MVSAVVVSAGVVVDGCDVVVEEVVISPSTGTIMKDVRCVV